MTYYASKLTAIRRTHKQLCFFRFYSLIHWNSGPLDQRRSSIASTLSSSADIGYTHSHTHTHTHTNTVCSGPVLRRLQELTLQLLLKDFSSYLLTPSLHHFSGGGWVSGSVPLLPSVLTVNCVKFSSYSVTVFQLQLQLQLQLLGVFQLQLLLTGITLIPI